MVEVHALADVCLADRCEPKVGNGLIIHLMVPQSRLKALFKTNITLCIMFVTLFVVYTHYKYLLIVLRVTYQYYYIFSVTYNRKCREIFGLVDERYMLTRRYA